MLSVLMLREDSMSATDTESGFPSDGNVRAAAMGADVSSDVIIESQAITIVDNYIGYTDLIVSL
tara:strand:- start:40 stop:231 length:192 start_codon:yes stop_codon:yes gene_type:complete